MPGVDDVEREVTVEALGGAEAEQESDPTTPVVADELDPVELERIEHGEHVVGEILLEVAVARSVGPAEAAEVERDDAVALGERRHQVTPLVPVLRPTVQEQHGIVAGGVGFGDVEAQAVGVDPAVGHAVDVRHLRRSAPAAASRRLYAAMAPANSTACGLGRSSCSDGGQSRA